MAKEPGIDQEVVSVISMGGFRAGLRLGTRLHHSQAASVQQRVTFPTYHRTGAVPLQAPRAGAIASRKSAGRVDWVGLWSRPLRPGVIAIACAHAADRGRLLAVCVSSIPGPMRQNAQHCVAFSPSLTLLPYHVPASPCCDVIRANEKGCGCKIR